MVTLVLDDAGAESLHGNIDAVGLAVVGAQTNLRIARHATTDPGHAQASFPVSSISSVRGMISGLMYTVSGMTGHLDGGTRCHFHNNDLLRDMHLRRGQASAIVLVHSSDHSSTNRWIAGVKIGSGGTGSATWRSPDAPDGHL